MMLSSSNECSVETPDETTGKETEFSLVGSLEINIISTQMCSDSAKLTNPRRR